MKISTDITNIKALSYSVVLLWKNPLNSLPPLSPDFCESIFGDKSATQYTLGRNGMVVNKAIPVSSINGFVSDIAPISLQLGFDRLVLTHSDKDQLLESYQILEAEIKRISFDSYLLTGQMGINIEYEVEFKSGHCQDYINKRFRAPNDHAIFQGSSITEIKIVMLESDKEAKMINVVIQPRNQKDNAFFIKLNDHYSQVKNQTFISHSELLGYIEETNAKLSDKVMPYLNLLSNEK